MPPSGRPAPTPHRYPSITASNFLTAPAVLSKRTPPPQHLSEHAGTLRRPWSMARVWPVQCGEARGMRPGFGIVPARQRQTARLLYIDLTLADKFHMLRTEHRGHENRDLTIPSAVVGRWSMTARNARGPFEGASVLVRPAGALSRAYFRGGSLEIGRRPRKCGGMCQGRCRSVKTVALQESRGPRWNSQTCCGLCRNAANAAADRGGGGTSG